MSLAAAAVLNGSALLLSCRTRSLHSMRPFARCFACTKDKVKGDGLLVGSASLRKVAKRTLLFPSASCGFVRASVNAAAADTSMDADAPITSSTPITDSAADGSLFPSYSSASLATESDSVVDADLSSSSPPRSSNPMKDAADALDIRVGRIIKAWRHPDADSLYVEEVDVGEPEPRTICSGLAKYIHLDDLQVYIF
ncbi:hypothetical protein HHK36_025334 [Tetracentron sinense]|uniref:tRNA-binding domain-containing protein n=1 Tax=Tetracentron sinense TaxID=13715 RepID=A0A834YPV6_TETSI|nr:hypothetical protein HHK36_025334 [Tetracentron sinense]